MTVRALARELGISATAVSLALRNSPRVSRELRERIQQRARESGYVPNARLSELMNEVRRSTTPVYRATLATFSLYPQKEPWKDRPYLKEVLENAEATAKAHGYQMEYFWLKQPGMSPARFRAILEARGIQGLFCLGSMDPEEEFPADLRKFAVVTFAASIPSKLHRVMSHFTSDAHALFEELLRRHYQRPGLCILVHGDRRTDYAYSSAYLSAWERQLRPPNVPILRSDQWEEEAFDQWFRAQRPDVIVMHQNTSYIAGVESYLKKHKLRIPQDIGLALLDLNPNLRRYTGMCQNPGQMGVTAAEMLIGRVLMRDLHIPQRPKVELVVGEWNEGRSLRPRSRSR